ncbi:MAG: beta-ketoacyl synthase N-terminal-like domain-containing protein, partial [Myxococcota bacterium]
MSEHDEPIAVTGVGALFPGAPTTADFWRDLTVAAERLSEVPRTHWLAEDFVDPRPGTPDKVPTGRGGFLPPTPFPFTELGVPPSTIPATDTAQLLALVVARRVLREATGGRPFDRDRVAVILGVASATELVAHMAGRLQLPLVERAMAAAGVAAPLAGQVSQVLRDSWLPWQPDTFPGLLGNVVAGRIANRLDLGGANYVVDAACAGSLAAVDAAVGELVRGRADLVVTGGVDTLNDILMYMCFAQTGALSPSGRCRPFAADADGTLLGEGIGLLALRRLADAERDRDPIYAVIRGVGSGSDGKGTSIYAPLAEGQARALRRAYARAGVSPATVGLVEAHGTGTRAGDAAELAALRQVYEEGGARPGATALGSVKGQIGHTKAAAGSAGLIKVVLALHHRVLPPTLDVPTGPGLSGGPFHLARAIRPWLSAPGTPRRAAVSALGFGGTNFHVVVEAYDGPARPPKLRSTPTELVVVSGADPAEAEARCRALAGAPSLAQAAWDSQRAFDPSAPVRVAVVAGSPTELAERLGAAARTLAGGPAGGAGVFVGVGPALGPVALLAPGQGAQRLGMGGALAIAFDRVREVWDRADPESTERVFPP